MQVYLVFASSLEALSNGPLHQSCQYVESKLDQAQCADSFENQRLDQTVPDVAKTRGVPVLFLQQNLRISRVRSGPFRRIRRSRELRKLHLFIYHRYTVNHRSTVRYGLTNGEKVAVIGAGIMGHGISMVSALAGYQVNMVDVSAERLVRALDSISADLALLLKNGLVTEEGTKNALARIKTTTSIADAVDSARFVTECITEDIAPKKELFRDLDQLCPEDVVLASNTSTFRITEIASATNKKTRVVGTHWWNPPYLMPLVEITKGAETSEATVDRARQFLLQLGKVPVVCKDHPGLIGVRLLAILVTEAIRILEEGLASAEDIDTAVRMSVGFRLPIVGPLETVDLGGLDTFLYAYEHLHRELGDRFKPPELFREKVERGEFGIKTGKGFYQYTPESIKSLIGRRDEWLVKRLKELRSAER